ncbi:MAG TPA: LecA/PA-IL family lectin [Pyrinomonadaceae bacterium]|nr:LecA/PA-IL family lectin [Pyrinomonadaceae bacterium]
MKKIFYLISVLFLVLALSIPALADTIRLKDGSVIRGEVVGFKDQQFTVLIGAGSKGRRSRTMIYVEDVESIEFDSTTAGTESASNEEPAPTAVNESVAPPTSNLPPEASSSNTSAPSSAASPTFFTIKILVRADNTNNGWTNSGLVVRKGQRLRITGSGRVSLGNGRYSTPAGLPTVPDNEKLMRTEPTGALIAVIGDDNDDFILVGTRRDFVSQRDGVLFLGVNEGRLTDNTGNFDVVIEAEAGGPR